MPLQHARHRIVFNPVEAGLGVCLRVVVGREEAVTLKSTRGHQDEDAESGVAEAEARRRLFGVHPDHRIHAVDVVVVDAPNLFGPCFVRRQFLEGFDRRQVV